MIPKIIHYCWFGNKPIPKEVKRYIDSWKKYLQGYQIICWNESNFNVEISEYTKKAYELKKYAFVSDYARLYALKKYGGIYFDVDIQVIKNLDNLLNCNALFGFESQEKVMTAFMACIPNHEIINSFLEYYSNKQFNENDLKPNTEILTRILSEKGLTINGEKQELENDVIIYANTYFNAFDFSDASLDITENTYTIHHCLGSWCSNKDQLIFKSKKLMRNVIGKKFYQQLKKLKRNFGDNVRYNL